MKGATALLLLAGACSGGVTPDLHGTDPYARDLALAQIDSMPDGATMRRVLELLEDTHPLPRRGAVDALGRIGDPALYPHTRARLADSDLQVCAAACRTAGRLGNPDAIPDLAALALDPSRPILVRQEAARSLGMFGRRAEVARTLIDLLPEGTEPYHTPGMRREGPYSEANITFQAHSALESISGRSDLPPRRAEWNAWYSATFGDGS